MAIVLIAASALYVMPRFELAFHGILYADLSQNPFDFTRNNPLCFRILTPLIAYAIRLPRSAFMVLPLIIGIILIASVYVRYRKRNFSGSDALAMSALVAFSTTIYIPLIAPGYTDTTSYLFVFLCFVFIRRKFLFFLFLSACLFNHEGNLLLVPAMIVYALRASKISVNEVIGIVISVSAAIGLYFGYRYYVALHNTILLSTGHYLSPINIAMNVRAVARLAPAGAFFSFKLLWFIPLLLFYLLWRRRESFDFLPTLFIITGVCAQLLFAFDITRLFGLAFIAILLSAERIKHEISHEHFSRVLWALIFLNFLIPQYYIGQDGIHDMFPPFAYFAEHYIESL